jgi:glycosyl transferase family 25
MSLPDIVYYINLAHRTDRKENFLQEMKKVDIPDRILQRQEAFYTPDDGAIGCIQSHIAVLEKFLESPFQSALICEDDLEWIGTKEELNTFFSKLFKLPFQVCLLAGNVWRTEPTPFNFLDRAVFVSTTSCYVVHKSYVEKLLKNYQNSLKGRLEYNTNPEQKSLYALDCQWTKLQEVDNWYISIPKFGRQAITYSDIEKRVVCGNW